MSTSSTLWLDMSLGILAAGLILGALLALTEWDRRRDRKAEREFHVPQHRASGLTEADVRANRLYEEQISLRRAWALQAAPVEVIRLDEQQPQERTEEMPRVETPVPADEPVEHIEVDEKTGLDGLLHDEPSAELAEPTEAQRRMADMHDEALWENEYRASRRRHDEAVAGFHTSATDRVIDEWLRGEERLPFLVEARRAAHEDVDDPSVEMDAAELAVMVAEAKAGAVR